MAVRAGNRTLVRKIDRLAMEIEMTKTAAMDSAVDRALRPEDRSLRGDRLESLSARFAKIPDRPDAYDHYGVGREWVAAIIGIAMSEWSAISLEKSE